MTSTEEIKALRDALESIHDFAHRLHEHPAYEFQGTYPAGSAMEEIAITAEMETKVTILARSRSCYRDRFPMRGD